MATINANVFPYAKCDTASATTAKVATLQNGTTFSLTTGQGVIVEFSHAFNAGTASTLNINNTGAKSIVFLPAQDGRNKGILDNKAALFVYNGSQWCCKTGYSV